MSNTESNIAALSGAIIKFLSDVKTYQKVLINHQEQLKKVERSHMGLLKELMNMEPIDGNGALVEETLLACTEQTEGSKTYERSDTMELLKEAFGDGMDEPWATVGEDKTLLLPSTRNRSLTPVFDTNKQDNKEQDAQIPAAKRRKTEKKWKKKRRPHFRFRVRAMFESGSWTEDGLHIMVPSKIIGELNGDLQHPLASMRKRMVNRDFVVRSSKGIWTVHHPDLNASNWVNALFNF